MSDLPDDVLGFIGDIAVGMFTQSHRKQACDLMAKYSPTEEPTGLGAVVKDRQGRTWVLATNEGFDGERWFGYTSQPVSFWGNWKHMLQPVEILSAGVAL